MQVTIKIDISELVYDIQNKTYLTGRSRSDGKNYRQVALMQANNDDENLNQIMRSIENAFARVQSELSEVLDVEQVESRNTLSLDGNAKELVLYMPSNFNTAATNSIGAAIHQFIVGAATAEWFMITNKSDSEDYNKLSQTSLEMLREALSKRIRPKRNTQS